MQRLATPVIRIELRFRLVDVVGKDRIDPDTL